MDRKCSLCGKLRHNSRTCPKRRRIRLFGAWLDISSSAIAMHKSFSIDSMNPSPSTTSSLSSSTISFEENPHAIALQESTKGRQWTKEEHGAFLNGLEKLGKGDWRGISRSYVKTRNSTQVASHAQKYFLGQKRRASLSDLVERKNHIPRLFGCPQILSSAEKTSPPVSEPDLELTLHTVESRIF